MGSRETLQSAKDRYILPNNAKEIDRMRNQHEWVKGCAGGLVKAPIDLDARDLRIMDSATADGFWISDLRSLLPDDAQFVGFDIAPELFNPVVLQMPNVTLEVQDLTKPFPPHWKNVFDLVHQRFVFPNFGDKDADEVLERLVDCVKPGGWIQLVEPDAITNLSDSRARSFAVLHALAGRIMANPNVSSRLVARLEQLGMDAICQQTVDITVGSAHSNRELGLRGRRNMQTILSHYMGVGQPEVMGLTPDQLKELPANVEDDMRRYNTVLRHYIIWARKPVTSQASQA